MPTFSDLARAAYCPRQLYYARREDDGGLPPDAAERIDLAFAYDEHVDAPDRRLRRLPIDRSPAAYRRNLDRLRKRDDWDRLVDPAATRTLLDGKDCRGIAHKILEPAAEADGTLPESIRTRTEPDRIPPPVPTIVSPGSPPENGVYEPQTVRAVAAAKALAWEREREVPRALVEYPAVGTVRSVDLTVRKTAAYRRALRTVRALDGPPPRRNDAHCESCDYRTQCGVKTRSLRSLLE
ncbi:CRISPR-associated protein Cas4 [Haloparvum sp. PAK95]|uniref:CRISPR-associated protein Cas4 n=1 Tax=Haloparvum sp. PAK95 TaxID=3418962 RepID=UPI003D2EEA03